MATTRIGVALQIDEIEGDSIIRMVVPMTGFAFVVAITGLFAPSLMGIALFFYGTVLAIMAGFTWLYVQIVAGVIIAKIVIDCFFWVYNGGDNYDY